MVITMKDSTNVDEYDVADINLVIRNLSKRQAAYKLLDARANWSMDKKAKERAKKENSEKNTLARAIVVSNSIQAGLLQFLQGFSKSKYPQKIFSDWDEAYEWLLSIKTKLSSEK